MIPLRRFVRSFALLIVLWIVANVAIGYCLEIFLGEAVAERCDPFGNAHLLEDAEEGAYLPLSDPAFLLHALVLGAIVFGMPAYLIARKVQGVTANQTLAPVFLALLTLTWLHRYVWNAGYPVVMRQGFVAYLCILLMMALAGFVLARHCREFVNR